MKVQLEKARDGNFTCKVTYNSSTKYLYSKYAPKRGGLLVEGQVCGDYIVLGLGLGYEVAKIARETNGKVIVVDYDDTFLNAISEEPILKKEIELKNLEIIVGNNYKDIDKELLRRSEIIINEKVAQLNVDFYATVLRDLSTVKAQKNEHCIVFLNHPTIADDCIEALENMNYVVHKLDWYDENKMILKVLEYEPIYLFTINFSPTIARISDKLNIPYISWTVDTPAYTLYQKEVNHPLFHKFVYDEALVEDLTRKGVEQIYYLPVAVNTKRLDDVVIHEVDKTSFSSQISFVGNMGNSEYTDYIEGKLNEDLKRKVSSMIAAQDKDTSIFLLKDLVSNELVDNISQQSGYGIKEEDFMSRSEKLAFFLGRRHSQEERLWFIKVLCNHFDVAVFGEKKWALHTESYKGLAEHFYIMPKIFKLSKINLNITRSFVESGLPMRVFDVLGSQGFLATNYKEDILRYFKNGRDLVIYRDLKDLIEIVQYYLNHEKERQEILISGYLNVKNNHNFEKRMQNVLDMVNAKIDTR